MLDHTFQHIPGIGPKLERQLWERGCQTWENVSRAERPPEIPESLWNKVREAIPRSRQVLAERNLPALHALIPAELQWRMIPDLRGEIAFLDIETTGLLPPTSRRYITVIGVFDGQKIYHFVRGENLDDFPEFIVRFPAVATYFGSGFDLPFILTETGISMPQVHFDTCFLLRRLGHTGGLKQVERQLGLSRPKEITGVTGEIAVLLWRAYQRTQDRRILDTLLAYNAADTIVLEYLLHYGYNALVKRDQLPFPVLRLEHKDDRNPYEIDPAIVKIIFHQRERSGRRTSRRVTPDGTLFYDGRHYPVGKQFAGKRVSVRETTDGTELHVYRGQRRVKKITLERSI